MRSQHAGAGFPTLRSEGGNGGLFLFTEGLAVSKRRTKSHYALAGEILSAGGNQENGFFA